MTDVSTPNTLIPGQPVEETSFAETAKPTTEIDFLHEIGSRLAAADPLHGGLDRVVEFISEVIKPDSCFIYVLEGDELVLRASKNPHPEAIDRLKLKMGEGITGWVAKNRKPVAVSRNAARDPRFQMFSELPEDTFEAFLSVPLISREKLVGVINLQHRLPHMHTRREVTMVSTIGFLVGSEVELARLETQVSRLSEQLETRKLVERAKGILQRDMGMTEEQAYLTIQKQSRQRRLTMKEVAEAIVLSDDVRKARDEGSEQ